MKAIRIVISIFCLFSFIYSFETQEALQKRFDFYKQARKFSDNSIKVSYTKQNGLTCEALDYKKPGDLNFKIPRELTLCAYYLFPFKFELASYLKEIPFLAEAFGQRTLYSVYLLTYNIMFLSSEYKEEVNQYIKEKQLEQYYEIEQTDMSLFDSFPKIALNKYFLEDEHYDLLQKYSVYNKNELDELRQVYDHVLRRVKQSEHKEAMLPWVIDFDRFRWAYSMPKTRAMQITFKNWRKVDNTDARMKNFTKWEKMNHEFNVQMAAKPGADCIVPFVDLCNHYQPKMPDLRDRRTINMETQFNYFINQANTVSRRGDEIQYTYIMQPNSVNLFLNYGFTLPNNVFDSYNARLMLGAEFSMDQLALCKELGCIENSVKKPSDITAPRFISFNFGQVNRILLNYGRVKNLKEKFNYQTYVKILSNSDIISNENEISAWMLYRNKCQELLSPKYHFYETNISEIQKYRNESKNMKSKWEETDEFFKKLLNVQIYEQINLISIYYQNILVKGIYGSFNKIIYHTNQELLGIREKYLSE